MKLRIILTLPLWFCSACQTSMDAGNYLGQYMPTIGERCESVQCFTEDGRARSDAIKAQRLKDQSEKGPPPSPGRLPAKSDDSDAEEATPFDTVKPF